MTITPATRNPDAPRGQTAGALPATTIAGMTMTTKPFTDSGIRPDITFADGSRMRSLPWGGRQYLGMGVRRWAGGFEAVELDSKTMEPLPDSDAERFATLADTAAWIRYVTASCMAALFHDEQPTVPAVKPIEVYRTPRSTRFPRPSYHDPMPAEQARARERTALGREPNRYLSLCDRVDCEACTKLRSEKAPWNR